MNNKAVTIISFIALISALFSCDETAEKTRANAAADASSELIAAPIESLAFYANANVGADAVKVDKIPQISDDENSGKASDSEKKTLEPELSGANNESKIIKADFSKIDVDLSAASNTFAYSAIYNMLFTPEKYIGKTIRISGIFAVYETETQNYYCCYIPDAAACCAQGIEFELGGDFSYPEDYPTPGDEITVTGIFDADYEGDYMYVQLIRAIIE